MKLDQRFMQLFSSEYQQIEADLSVGCCWGCGGVVVVLPDVVSVFVLVVALLVVILAATLPWARGGGVLLLCR